MGSVPPVDSMTISAQKTLVEMCTEAIFDMAMLSSLLPNRRDLTRLTRCGLMIRRVGNTKLPCVQRLAAKVSAGEESMGLAGVVMVSAQIAELPRGRTAGGVCPHMSLAGWLHPFQRAFSPDPDVADDQDREEDQHFEQAEQAEGLESYCPGKKKNCFHVEHDEEDGNDVITHGVAAAGAVDGIDAAFVGHQLGLAGIGGAHQLRGQKCDRQQSADDGDEDENGDVILRH